MFKEHGFLKCASCSLLKSEKNTSSEPFDLFTARGVNFISDGLMGCDFWLAAGRRMRSPLPSPHSPFTEKQIALGKSARPILLASFVYVFCRSMR